MFSILFHSYVDFKKQVSKGKKKKPQRGKPKNRLLVIENELVATIGEVGDGD